MIAFGVQEVYNQLQQFQMLQVVQVVVTDLRVHLVLHPLMIMEELVIFLQSVPPKVLMAVIKVEVLHMQEPLVAEVLLFKEVHKM